MKDIVSIRKIRPSEPEPSPRQVPTEAEGVLLPGTVETLLARSFLARAGIGVLASDDLERGDNCSSLAARTALELHPEVGVDEPLTTPPCVVAEYQVIFLALIHRRRKARIHLSRRRILVSKSRVSAMPVHELRVLLLVQHQELNGGIPFGARRLRRTLITAS